MRINIKRIHCATRHGSSESKAGHDVNADNKCRTKTSVRRISITVVKNNNSCDNNCNDRIVTLSSCEHNVWHYSVTHRITSKSDASIRSKHAKLCRNGWRLGRIFFYTLVFFFFTFVTLVGRKIIIKANNKINNNTNYSYLHQSVLHDPTIMMFLLCEFHKVTAFVQHIWGFRAFLKHSIDF